MHLHVLYTLVEHKSSSFFHISLYHKFEKYAYHHAVLCVCLLVCSMLYLMWAGEDSTIDMGSISLVPALLHVQCVFPSYLMSSYTVG